MSVEEIDDKRDDFRDWCKRNGGRVEESNTSSKYKGQTTTCHMGSDKYVNFDTYAWDTLGHRVEWRGFGKGVGSIIPDEIEIHDEEMEFEFDGPNQEAEVSIRA